MTTYSDDFKVFLRYSNEYGRISQEINDFLSLDSNPLRVLDIGAGTGFLLSLLNVNKISSYTGFI